MTNYVCYDENDLDFPKILWTGVIASANNDVGGCIMIPLKDKFDVIHSYIELPCYLPYSVPILVFSSDNFCLGMSGDFLKAALNT